MNRKIYTVRAVLYNKKTVLRPSVRQTTHPFCKCLFNQLIVSAAYKLIYFLLIEKDKLLCTTQLSRFFTNGSNTIYQSVCGEKHNHNYKAAY